MLLIKMCGHPVEVGYHKVVEKNNAVIRYTYIFVLLLLCWYSKVFVFAYTQDYYSCSQLSAESFVKLKGRSYGAQAA
jgi:hypothetical protein